MVSGPDLLRRLVLWTLYVVAWGGVWLMNPGTASPEVWAVLAGGSLIALLPIATVSPELLRERLRPSRPGPDSRALRVVRVSSAMTAAFAVMDGTMLHWSAPMPGFLRIIGVVAFLAGFACVGYAMSTNPFFSPEIRIQDDRGHRLIDTGPYGVVRHPGYAGMLVFGAAMPLAFGSWWACLPTLVFLAFIAGRVSREDRFLHESLAGYREYAGRVRSRLIPGVW